MTWARKDRGGTPARGSGRWPICLATAMAVHAACSAWALSTTHGADPSPPRRRELVVEMLAPEPEPEPEPEPVPEPVSVPVPEPPVRRAKAPARRATTTKAPAKPAEPQTEPAKAGALLTAESDAQPNLEAVRFVTDPHGQRYGTGLVARGGRAEHAPIDAHAAAPTPSGRTTAASETGGPGETVFATELSRQPRLAAPDACRGYFPERAALHQGDVTLVVSVLANGRVTRSVVEAETPAGQGFGAAARACLEAQRFEPALDPNGRLVAARTRVRIHFAR